MQTINENNESVPRFEPKPRWTPGFFERTTTRLIDAFDAAVLRPLTASTRERSGRRSLGTALRLFYGLREYGANVVPAKGAALLIGNRATRWDAFVVARALKRPVRTIFGDRPDFDSALETARIALRNGEVVAIFPEPALPWDGEVRAFPSNFLQKLGELENVPIIPFAIAGFYGSRWGKARGKGYPTPFPYRPSISFGAPFDVAAARARGLSEAGIAQRLTHLVQELGVDACDYARRPENVRLLPPTRQSIRGLRTFGGRLRLADSTGKKATGRQTLLQILVLRRLFKRVIGNEKYVGVLLPTSVAGVLANAAAAYAGYIPVNLNYTFTNEINDYCVKKVGIEKIITTKLLLNKLPKLKLNAELLLLEELAKNALRTSDKLIGFLQSLLPTCVLERVIGLTKQKLADVNTIVFTSGSTGMPKGTILTNANIAANTLSFGQAALLWPDERILGTLPFFHSFGYAVTGWFPLVTHVSCVYHYNPLDYRGVAAIARKYRPSIIVSTPTFMRTYLRRCDKEDFASCVYPVPGAEKTPKELFAAWFEKFGINLSEGFGATELSPVLSENLAEDRIPDAASPYRKIGSIGRPNTGFVAKVVDLETGEELPPNESGMLLVKGNSVTPGYFEDPDQTAKIFRDGWYVTGDVAKIDEDNFIFITGRQTRTSKIGGEMVPHGLVEERLLSALAELEKERDAQNGSNDRSDAESQAESQVESTGPRLVVTAVPDEKKGERLVVLFSDLGGIDPDAICKRAAESGLPQLWTPAIANFRQVDAIPILGTGKLSLKEIKDLALRLYGLVG